jgi:uncharacterized protein DUF6665
MNLRPPRQYGPSSSEIGTNPIDIEIAAEKAAALGRSGEKVEQTLARLRMLERDAPERAASLKEAAEAVYAYFIQRELCGMRRHHDVIREYGIPNEVLVKLGAK